MAELAVAGASVSAADGPSIDDELADMFGDVSTADSSDDETPPTSTTVEAGTPPADPATPSATPLAPEGTDPAARTETPSAVAAPVAPDVVPVTPAEDPLAGATPFTYRVNHEEKTLDGIQVLGDRGFIGTPDALTEIRQRLSTLDNVMSRSREQYGIQQAYERVSAWDKPKADGTTQSFTGLDGIVELRVDNARKDAEIKAYEALLSDPNLAVALFAPDPSDPQNKVVFNAQLMENAALRMARAQDAAESTLRQTLNVARTAPAPAAPSAPTVDVARHAPDVIKSAAGAQESSLTPEDRSLLTEQLPRYVRQATSEDVLTNPTWKVGQMVVDASFTKQVQHVIGLRASAKAQAASIAAATTENARKLAAAAITRPQTPQAPAVRSSDTPKDTRSRDEQLSAMEDRLLGRM